MLTVFTQTSNFCIKKLCCMCLRTTKQWSRWFQREEVLAMRHVSRTHRVALDWLFDRINLDPKIQIKYIDTENQLADMLTKGNFTRDEWNHLLFLFNISHFSSTVCSEGMAKRVQQDSGEEGVTAKSRPMRSLIARATSNLSSSAWESPVKKSFESQSPWSAKIERRSPLSTATNKLLEARTQLATRGGAMTKLGLLMRGKLTSRWVMERSNPLCTLKEKQGHSNSSLETTKQNGNCHWDPDHFLKRVNDQVRKRQKLSSRNVTETDEKHSVTWRMFMSVRVESAVIMGKNYLDNCHSITNTKDLALKQMYDISAKLLSEQDEIYGVVGKSFMDIFVFDWWWKSHQSSAYKALRILRFCIVSCKGERKLPIKRWMKRQIGMVQNISGIQKLRQSWRWANGIRVEYFPRIQYVAAQWRSQTFAVEIRWDTPENFTGRIIFMSMFNDISRGSQDNEKECESNARLVCLHARDSEQDNGHCSVLVQRKSGILSVKIVHKVNGTTWRRRWC